MGKRAVHCLGVQIEPVGKLLCHVSLSHHDRAGSDALGKAIQFSEHPSMFVGMFTDGSKARILHPSHFLLEMSYGVLVKFCEKRDESGFIRFAKPVDQVDELTMGTVHGLQSQLVALFEVRYQFRHGSGDLFLPFVGDHFGHFARHVLGIVIHVLVVVVDGEFG